MAKNKRVFELAKELGVQSKDIVDKCKAENIPGIKNHMSSVSVGLAVTISEWFGDGGEEGGSVATAVETAAPVDIKKAKAKAKRKAPRKTTSDASPTTAPETEEASPTGTMTPETAAKKTSPTTEAAPTTPGTSAKTPQKTSDAASIGESPEAGAKAKVEEPTDDTAGASSTAPAQPADGTDSASESPADAESEVGSPTASEAKGTEGADEGKDASGGSVVMNVPQRPKDVKPVGPMLEEPKKTRLTGPKVIRVEAPDVVPAPRPKRAPRDTMPRSGPRGGRGASYGMVEGEGGARGGPGAGAGTGAGRTTRRNKRRSSDRRSARGGRDEQNVNWRKQDLLEREQRLNRSGGFFRTHRRDNLKRAQGQKAETPVQAGGKVVVEEPLTIKELSAATGVKTSDIIKQLFLSGTPATINSTIEAEKAIEIMLEYGIDLDVVEQKTAQEQISEQFQKREMHDEQLRAPVVTILGHVDHGKTSLLDRIRNTSVAEGEAGGITQATSAFRVPVKAGESERQIVFLDTPGHEAFTEMRARGARVTDVIVLVVAADDGVMPQTVESINHAKAAGVPIIVALNKIDKPEATDQNIQRILGQLAEQGLNPTDWGGDTEIVRTSAIKGEGIQDLLDHIDFQAQLHEWKADFAGPAEGSVIEAQMEEGRGPVARLLVQQGRLKKGDFIVIGRAYGRVRDIINDHGERVDHAGPSTPVAISGIDVVPDAGDRFYVVDSLRAAEGAAEERRRVERERGLAQPKVTLDNIFDKLKENEQKELNLIIKADVQGSVETLRNTLSNLEIEDVRITVLHTAVGGINENDVTLAAASGAIIIGFNVTTSAKARQAAEQKGIDIRLYDVIYDITDDVEKAAKGLLDPEHRLEVLGHAEVRQVFKVSKVGMVAGCYVTDGTIERNAQIRVTREGIVVEKDRRLEQLKRFKDDAREVRAGQECGMKIDGYNDIKEGDVLECYKTVEVARV